MKKYVFYSMLLICLLIMSTIPLKVKAVNRTPYFGINIKADLCDKNGITPADVKNVLNEAYTAKGITFNAIKIQYGYDASNPTTIANKIKTWVDYFDNYYSYIIVESRSVMILNRKLTVTEATDYYTALANVLNTFPAVKVFCGEAEPEVKQMNPYTGEKLGNSKAYANYEEMKTYISMLKSIWDSRSSIPFSFESIPMESDDGTYVSSSQWNFSPVQSSDYWSWIQANQEVLSVNAWSAIGGLSKWAEKSRDWNRPIFLGETFLDESKEISELENIIDTLNAYGKLTYFFYWDVIGMDKTPAMSGSPEPYVYLRGGWTGHHFCHLQTKLDWAGDGMLTLSTVQYKSTYAYAYKAVSLTSSGSLDEEFKVVVNFDIGAKDSQEKAIEIASWVTSTGYIVYGFRGVLKPSERKVYVRYLFMTASGSIVSPFEVCVPSNTWHTFVIQHRGTNIYLWCDGNCLYSEGGRGRTTDTPITNVYIGRFVTSSTTTLMKLYVETLQQLRDFNTVLWQATFANGGYDGFTRAYSEPSYVYSDNEWRYSNGAHWVLDQLKS